LSGARYFGWSALAIATLAAAVAPDFVTLPEPNGAIALNHATYLPEGGSGGVVSLPHSIYPRIAPTAETVRYQIDFNLPAAIDDDLFVFIPSVNRRISMAFNGKTFFGFESSVLWTGPLIGTSIMARLPNTDIAGHNRLTVVVEKGAFAVPTYLSRIYLGTEAELAPNFKLLTFLNNELKTMALGAQALLGFGLIFAYFFRPNDPLFPGLPP
jgi:hypothetical protein